MQNRFKEHYKNIISYDLINKLNYNTFFKIPKISKINLNIGFKESSINKKKIIPIVLLMNIITGQKGFITKSRKNKILLKIKKGSLVGCKTTLRSNNCFSFLENLILFLFPNNKNHKILNISKKNKSNITFNIKNVLDFIELEKEFLKFNKIPPINITINSNSKNHNELFLLLNSFNFPLKMRK